jgi:hypothetical protein
MALESDPIYIETHRALVECYDLVGLKVLCGKIGINRENIVVNGRTIDEAADALIRRCRQEGKDEKLIFVVLDDRPACPAVKALREVILKSKSYVIISLTSDLTEYYERLKASIRDQHVNLNVTLGNELYHLPPANRLMYYSNLRDRMNVCSSFIGIVGKTLEPDIGYIHRPLVEIEYECAFFKRVPAYLYIPIEIKEKKDKHKAKIKSLKSKKKRIYLNRINHMLELQVLATQGSALQSESIFYYKDPVDLFYELNGLLHKLEKQIIL